MRDTQTLLLPFRRFLPQDETLVTFCHAQFFMDDIFPSSLRDEKVDGGMFIMVSAEDAPLRETLVIQLYNL